MQKLEAKATLTLHVISSTIALWYFFLRTQSETFYSINQFLPSTRQRREPQMPQFDDTLGCIESWEAQKGLNWKQTLTQSTHFTNIPLASIAAKNIQLKRIQEAAPVPWDNSKASGTCWRSVDASSPVGFWQTETLASRTLAQSHNQYMLHVCASLCHDFGIEAGFGTISTFALTLCWPLPEQTHHT